MAQPAEHDRRVDGILVCGSIVVPASELRWQFSRSSGPGGQGVNTTDSRVQLSFDLARTTSIPARLKARALQRLAGRLVDGRVVVTASEYRSQHQNRRAAEQRLASILAAAVAPPTRPRVPTRPGKAATDRRINAKKTRGEVKRLRGAVDER